MLQLFNDHLVPEITMDKEDRCILVISCVGFRQSVSALEQLTEGIIEYANWKVVKYRQPGPMEFIPLNGQKVKRKNILRSQSRRGDAGSAINYIFPLFCCSKIPFMYSFMCLLSALIISW